MNLLTKMAEWLLKLAAKKDPHNATVVAMLGRRREREDEEGSYIDLLFSKQTTPNDVWMHCNDLVNATYRSSRGDRIDVVTPCSESDLRNAFMHGEPRNVAYWLARRYVHMSTLGYSPLLQKPHVLLGIESRSWRECSRLLEAAMRGEHR